MVDISDIFFIGDWIAEQKTDFTPIQPDLAVFKGRVQLNNGFYTSRLVAMGSTHDNHVSTWIRRRDGHPKGSKAGAVPFKIRQLRVDIS